MNLEDDFFKQKKVTLCNLFLYSMAELGEYARSGQSQENRVACVAELFVREFMKKGSAENEINAVLPDGELKEFRQTIGMYFLDNREIESLLLNPLWGEMREMNAFSAKCQVAVRERLIVLCKRTDGFIPVYSDSGAFFIPFHLVETEDDRAVIIDRAGHPVENWTKPFARVFDLAKKNIERPQRYQCVIFCDQSGLPRELIGNSLILPLYLAWLRRAKEIQYNPLRVLVTGTIDEFGLISAVETEEKASGFQDKFDYAYFFFPESKKYIPSERNVVALPKMDLDRLKKKFQDYVEAKGLFIPSYKEAMKRLKVLAEDRDVNYSEWEILLARLVPIMNAIHPDGNPPKHLLCLMLESSILCHMGKTAEALEKNRKAQAFARKHDLKMQLLRLQIDELVDFEDMEDFTALAQSVETLEIEIDKCDDPDLKMRYHGTMGQAHSFGALSGEDGFFREKAKEHFQKAIQYAFQKAEKDDEPNAENDIAQDFNYLFMWYALFEPESKAALQAFDDANKQIDSLNGDGQVDNERYLKQYRAMSLYRALLGQTEDVVCPDAVCTGVMQEIDVDDYRLPVKENDWQAALTGKYVGAIKAARGDAEAKEIFDACIRILEKKEDPVLQYIQMTILSEAFRSLGDARYREQALSLADYLLDSYPKSIPPWEKYLQGQGEFPGLRYWR